MARILGPLALAVLYLMAVVARNRVCLRLEAGQLTTWFGPVPTPVRLPDRSATLPGEMNLRSGAQLLVLALVTLLPSTGWGEESLAEKWSKAAARSASRRSGADPGASRSVSTGGGMPPGVPLVGRAGNAPVSTSTALEAGARETRTKDVGVDYDLFQTYPLGFRAWRAGASLKKQSLYACRHMCLAEPRCRYWSGIPAVQLPPEPSSSGPRPRFRPDTCVFSSEPLPTRPIPGAQSGFIPHVRPAPLPAPRPRQPPTPGQTYLMPKNPRLPMGVGNVANPRCSEPGLASRGDPAECDPVACREACYQNPFCRAYTTRRGWTRTFPTKATSPGTCTLFFELEDRRGRILQGKAARGVFGGLVR